jgi:hypothetical protein
MSWMPRWHLHGGGERDKTLGRPPGLRPRMPGEVFLTRTTATSLVFCAIARLDLAKKIALRYPWAYNSSSVMVRGGCRRERLILGGAT